MKWHSWNIGLSGSGPEVSVISSGNVLGADPALVIERS